MKYSILPKTTSDHSSVRSLQHFLILSANTSVLTPTHSDKNAYEFLKWNGQQFRNTGNPYGHRKVLWRCEYFVLFSKAYWMTFASIGMTVYLSVCKFNTTGNVNWNSSWHNDINIPFKCSAVDSLSTLLLYSNNIIRTVEALFTYDTQRWTRRHFSKCSITNHMQQTQSNNQTKSLIVKVCEEVKRKTQKLNNEKIDLKIA